MLPVDAVAHVFVDRSFDDSSDSLSAPQLADDDTHHLTRVLRLAPGADITVGDGRGRWRHCRLLASGEIEPVGEIIDDPRPTPELTVAFALVKGDRPDLVVRKLTEIGVDRIVPFVAERSVVHWETSKVHAKLQRLSDIARQAAMQCRRSFLPAIGMAAVADVPPHSLPGFADVAALDNAAVADPLGGPPGLNASTILVGPEGGWSPLERRVGLPRVRLGSHVLRTETAATVAGALLVALRSGIVAAAGRVE